MERSRVYALQSAWISCQCYKINSRKQKVKNMTTFVWKKRPSSLSIWEKKLQDPGFFFENLWYKWFLDWNTDLAEKSNNQLWTIMSHVASSLTFCYTRIKIAEMVCLCSQLNTLKWNKKKIKLNEWWYWVQSSVEFRCETKGSVALLLSAKWNTLEPQERRQRGKLDELLCK